jgi:hypothetical protein
MRRTPFVALALALAFALASAASSTPAAAATPRVLVTGPSGDALTQRIEREASSLGLVTVRGDDTTGCSTGAAARAATTEDVRAVLCTNGTVVLVWSVSSKGIHLDDVLMPPDQDTPTATLAMRAAEVARVKIAAALEPPKPPPIEVLPSELRERPEDAVLEPHRHDDPGPLTLTSDEVDALEADPNASARSTGVGTNIGLGIGTTLGSIENATFSADFAGSIGRHAALSLRIEAPLAVDSSQGYDASTGLALGGISFPFARPSADIIPRLGAGTGFAWLNMQSPTDSSASMDTKFFIVAVATAGASLKVSGILRLAADASIGSSFHRVVIESSSGTKLLEWGQPFGMIATRLELLIP